MTITEIATMIVADHKNFEVDAVELISSRVNVCDLPALAGILEMHRTNEHSTPNVALAYIEMVS